jgi:hypothetical protein
MKNTFSFFSQRNVLMSFLLTGLFFLVGANSANAQQLARGTANPYTGIAQSFGVTAYELGHFDQAEVITALQNVLTPIKPLIGHGASEAQELEYAYVSAVLADVEGSSIAVEISLLKRLDEMKNNKHLNGPMNKLNNNGTVQLANLYNETVNELQ